MIGRRALEARFFVARSMVLGSTSPSVNKGSSQIRRENRTAAGGAGWRGEKAAK